MSPRPPWFRLAANALVSARDKDWDGAVHATSQIAERYGAGHLPQVMCAWIDTMASGCGLDPKGKPIGLLWMHEDTSEITDADDTPPPVRWAGRLVAARLADDETQFRALINACSGDEEWSANVQAVLMVCGTMLRTVVSS